MQLLLVPHQQKDADEAPGTHVMTDRILSVESLAGFPFSILERSYTASVSLTSA